MSVNSPENILLNLPDEQAATVRGIFDELAARGFPPQRQTPHITVTFSPNMAPQVVERAREILPSAVPSELSRRGVVVFGTGKKQTVAWLLEARTSWKTPPASSARSTRTVAARAGCRTSRSV